MKKSEIYYVAQACVLRDEYISDSKKLEVLRELMAKEDIALFTEKEEEKNRKEKAQC